MEHADADTAEHAAFRRQLKTFLFQSAYGHRNIITIISLMRTNAKIKLKPAFNKCTHGALNAA